VALNTKTRIALSDVLDMLIKFYPYSLPMSEISAGGDTPIRCCGGDLTPITDTLFLVSGRVDAAAFPIPLAEPTDIASALPIPKAAAMPSAEPTDELKPAPMPGDAPTLEDAPVAAAVDMPTPVAVPAPVAAPVTNLNPTPVA
jgi:hypothetical protein